MVYRECYLSWRIRSHNTIRVDFDYILIYLRIMKGKGAMGPGKNKEENTSGGVPTTGVTSTSAQRTVGALPRLHPGLSYQHFIFTLISHSSSLNSPNNKLSFKPAGSSHTCTGMQREFQLSYLFLYSESRMVFSFPSASSRTLSQTARIKDSF